MNNKTPPTPETAGDDLLHIPPNVLVPCPIAHPLMTRVDQCPVCPHFVGLADRFGDDSKHPFGVRYMLRCSCPRNLGLVEFKA